MFYTDVYSSFCALTFIIITTTAFNLCRFILFCIFALIFLTTLRALNQYINNIKKIEIKINKVFWIELSWIEHTFYSVAHSRVCVSGLSGACAVQRPLYPKRVYGNRYLPHWKFRFQEWTWLLGFLFFYLFFLHKQDGLATLLHQTGERDCCIAALVSYV